MTNIDNAQNLYADPRDTSLSNQGYSELGKELAGFDGIVIGVLWDKHFAGRETPPSLRFEHFAQAWGSVPGVRVVALSADQARSYSVLFKGKLDVLVLPYGGVVPMDAYHFYSGQTFNYFLRRGGAILTTGGIPFSLQAKSTGEIMDISTPEGMQAVYDKWIAKFGVKYYQCLVSPEAERADDSLLPELGAQANWQPSTLGVIVNNSSHEPVPKPSFGNVFPERYPARQVLPLLQGLDAAGEVVSTSAVLTQDFANGSRRIHFTHEAATHPLSPEAPRFAPLLRGLLELLTNRLFVKDVEAQYACYRQGEAVRLRGEIVSFEPAACDATLEWDIVDSAGAAVASHKEELTLQPSQALVCEWTWSPQSFADDEYTVRISLHRGRRCVSRAANAFVVWSDDVIRRGPAIGIQGRYFTVAGRSQFITGTNYYESTRGEAMWFRPDVANVIRDHRQMAATGVNMIRPHYHHLKWFKDYLLYHHGRLLPFYEELAAVDSPRPDERAWRIWDLFIYLGQKYGIVYNGDLFTLVPEEMGDPRGWFGTVEAVYDTAKRPAQKEFLLALDRRYRQVPGILWDLFNEPFGISEEAVSHWAQDLGQTMKADGSARLLSVGGPAHLPAGVDCDCPHGKLREEFTPPSERPVLLQELHFDRPEALTDELDQAEGLRSQAVLAIRNGAAGWMPWSWTRQMRLWQDTYEHHHTFPMEKWDDRLGLHTHDDATLKPAGRLFRDLACLLADVEPLEYGAANKTVITSAGKLIARLPGESGTGGYEILHVANEKLLAAMALGKVSVAGRELISCDSPLYLFVIAPRGDFGSAPQLLVRCECPCDLTLRRGAKRVELVNLSPRSCTPLKERVDFFAGDGTTQIAVTARMSPFWLRVWFV